MPDPRVITDVDALKALAHPLRQRMLAHLQLHGAATSAMLAERLGVDRGAASYHLRQLHRYGFIADEPERHGRRRFWRYVPQDLRLPPRQDDEELNLAADEVLRLWHERGQRAMEYFDAHRDEFGEFAHAATGSFGAAVLTPDELRQFAEEYIALLNRWQRDPADAPPGARHVTALFYMFPTPEEGA
ncbi:ArsR/SmtB family transcription factor [Dactylosporangium darangshiense]|uniref:Helix-turn-helix domain-containing protein n=1 Tax=Dactylosporangium darangshiense TaxID=579108 RepID=A0ABP8D0K7_9ACTN